MTDIKLQKEWLTGVTFFNGDNLKQLSQDQCFQDYQGSEGC